jgi:hypothetical protein
MSGPAARRLASAATRSLFRPPTRDFSERSYVRLAGLTAYAGRDDVVHFMARNGVDTTRLTEAGSLRFPSSAAAARAPPSEFAVSCATDSDSDDDGTLDAAQRESEAEGIALAESIPLLAQGQSDLFMNHSVWVFDAGSRAAAADAVEKLSGKVCGLKLVRAAAVDRKIVQDLVGSLPALGPKSPASSSREGGPSSHRRRRMHVIGPLAHERDRALLLTGLPNMLPVRHVWAFFGSYEVVNVRLLRKDGVASVVFRTPDEAQRALRERANLPLQDQERTQIKQHA